ncbi:unnamed protein product [Toxocara canis]|nr:unnamed protein product [Toxocara canis]
MLEVGVALPVIHYFCCFAEWLSNLKGAVGLMLPPRAIPFLAQQARLQRLLPLRTSLGAIRTKFVFGKEALGSNVPVGGRMGAPEDPELHTYDGVYRGTPSKGDKPIPDFIYREPRVGDTYVDRCVSYFISACLWFWFTYHMYYHSGHIFGHWYMPYLNEFTDEELGIPPDDAPDPVYWGNHGEKYGTYR